MMESDLRILSMRVGARIELIDIELRSLAAELVVRDFEQPLEIGVSWDVAWEWPSDGRLEYLVTYSVAEEQGRNPTIKTTFAATYEVRDAEDFQLDEFDAFGQVSVIFSTFPYLRELVQSLTVRAGLPPLTLHTLHSPMDGIESSAEPGPSEIETSSKKQPAASKPLRQTGKTPRKKPTKRPQAT